MNIAERNARIIDMLQQYSADFAKLPLAERRAKMDAFWADQEQHWDGSHSPPFTAPATTTAPDSQPIVAYATPEPSHSPAATSLDTRKTAP